MRPARAWRGVVLFGVAAGCGRVGFDAVPGAGLEDAGVLIDADPCGPLIDDFEDGVPAAIWAPFAAPGVIVTEASTLAVTLADGATGYGGYDSSCMRDLRQHALVVEVIGVPASLASVETLVSLRAGSANTLGLRVENGELVAFKRVGGNYVELSATPYDPSAQRFWRLRAAAGVQYWESSPEQATWTLQHSETSPIDLTSILVRIAAGAFAAQPSPGTAVFERVHLTL